MKIVTIIDTETSGLDPKSSYLLEVAAVRFSVEHAAVVDVCSWLVHAEDNEAFSVNGIPPGLVRDAKLGPLNVAEQVRIVASSTDAIVAHNAAFDSQWLPSLEDARWICSANDIEWPRASDSRSLVAVCLAHGVPVTSAHRALTDCLLLARLFERVAELGHDVNRMLEDALLPRITLQSLQPFADNDKARAAGFRFDAPTKRWLKRVRKDRPGEYSFKTREIDQ